MQLAICDDEKEIRELYAEKIKHFYPDADLVQYRSGEELLIAYRKPDILLLDIQMPGNGNCETAARELQRDGNHFCQRPGGVCVSGIRRGGVSLSGEAL